MYMSIHHINRWNDTDNKVVTDKIISEVRGQFPQFTDGDIRVTVVRKQIRLGTIIPALYIVHVASCKCYFQTLCQRERKD